MFGVRVMGVSWGWYVVCAIFLPLLLQGQEDPRGKRPQLTSSRVVPLSATVVSDDKEFLLTTLEFDQDIYVNDPLLCSGQEWDCSKTDCEPCDWSGENPIGCENPNCCGATQWPQYPASNHTSDWCDSTLPPYTKLEFNKPSDKFTLGKGGSSFSFSFSFLSLFLSFFSFSLSLFLLFLSFSLSLFLSFSLSLFLSFSLSLFLSFSLSLFLSFSLSLFSFSLSLFLSFCLSLFLSFSFFPLLLSSYLFFFSSLHILSQHLRSHLILFQNLHFKQITSIFDFLLVRSTIVALSM